MSRRGRKTDAEPTLRYAASAGGTCPDAAVLADVTQVAALRAQMLDAVDRALADGDLRDGAPRRLRRLAAKVHRAPVRRTATTAARDHRRAAGAFGRACRLLSR